MTGFLQKIPPDRQTIYLSRASFVHKWIEVASDKVCRNDHSVLVIDPVSQIKKMITLFVNEGFG
jgi:hypothetical protein